MSPVARLAAVAFVLSAAPLAAVPVCAQSAVRGAQVAPSAPAASTAPSQPARAEEGPVSLAPRVEHVAAGVREPAAALARDPVPGPKAPGKGDTKRNRALMIVGGAGLIVGAIVPGTSGTLIMVAGAVTGLYGLYKFLE